jgi:amino-acid N-acetyltransferase
MTIRPAQSSDLVAVRQLLQDGQLPLDGVEAHVQTMVVATRGAHVVGAAAVELYAGGALLRSVVVSPDAQGQRLGHRLTEAALDLAKRRGADMAFLLTTTAEGFFPRLGFEHIARADVPASVQASVEFQSACPVSAIVMRKRLV